MTTIDKTLDIQDIVSPRSRMVIEATLAGLVRGQTLRVLTKDRDTRESIPAICSALGYTLLELGTEQGTFSITVRK